MVITYARAPGKFSLNAIFQQQNLTITVDVGKLLLVMQLLKVTRLLLSIIRHVAVNVAAFS